MTDRDGRLRVGIVGCGDVAHRHYLPALASMADSVTLAAVADPRDGAGEAVASAVADWSPGTRVFREVDEMLRHASLDAVYNLTPAPRHGTVNQAILEAGAACYSEKPIASSVPEADRLITTAADRGVLLLCAPGSAVSKPIRWLKELADSGRLGPPTLAVAHFADPGPADWDEYTGDPAAFYREGVGPVVRPWRLPTPRDDDRPRPRPTRPGDGHDRPADPPRAWRTAGGPADRGDDAR